MKTSRNIQKGSVILWVIILVLILIGGVYYLSTRKPAMNGNNSAIISNAPALTVDQVSDINLPDITSEASSTDLTQTPIELINGKFNGQIAGGQYQAALKIGSSTFAYGDLDGDGASDLIATIDVNTGGTGTFTYLLLFINKNGTPQFTASQLLGDRIKVNQITIANRIITANIITQGPGEPMCCGTMPKTLTYKLQGNSLVDVAGVKDSTSDSRSDSPMPVINSITPTSGPIGTIVKINGSDLAGFEGDLDAWIQNATTGEEGFLPGIGSVPRADQTIQVKITDQVCKTNNSYSGKPCVSFMTIMPGVYSIYAKPWDKKSNLVTFTVTK